MTQKNANKLQSELFIAPAQLVASYGLVQDLVDGLPERIPDILVSAYAAGNRVLPEGSPYPGPWRNEFVPYAVEIMDELSALSRTREVIWIKCSQIGATSIVENFIAYIVSQVPGPAMYVSSKEDLLKKWVNKRLAPLAVSCNLNFFAQHLMHGQRRSGNQMFSKEFPGGSLDLVSAQSESNLRQDSIRYLILDEAGAYPWDVQGFGDPIEIARARTANWRSRAKIFIPSTPGLEGECRMWSLFQEGDQRRYFVPCPHCGGRQVLRFPSEPDYFYENFASAKVQWETKAGHVDGSSIHFDCVHCREQIFEVSKYDMVNGGVWAPTAKAQDTLKKSYQIGRLYSLMEDWVRLVKMEVKAEGNPLLLQAHHNHNCGIPYRETSVKMDQAKIYELRGNYDSGKIPSDDLLFLTASVDVQRGGDTDPDKPPRLEMEICGHGIGYRTWSVLYKVFPGAIDDAYEGAWEDLYQFFLSGKAEFLRSDGAKYQPTIAFVDSGDGKYDTVVFDFCSRLRGFYPCKGAKELKESNQGLKTTQVLDEAGPKDRDRFRLNKKGGVPYVVISTNWYKKRLYRSLAVSVKRKAQGLRGSLYCDFPRDYTNIYFDMLTSEEERSDHTFYRPTSRANEALDLRVYNMCAGEFWLSLEVQRLQRDAKRAGRPPAFWEHIHSRHVLDSYAKAQARRDVTPAALPVSNIVSE